MRRSRGPRLCGALVVSALALGACGGEEDATTSPETAIPPETVAVIDGLEDGAITQQELDEAIRANAEASGQTAPAPDTPEYGLLAGEALDRLILERWVEGEAGERGVEPETLSGEGVEELRGRWGPRTECPGEIAGRLCGDVSPPADIPPASG